MKVLTGFLTLGGLIATGFGAWQVWIDKGGKVSPDEAMPIFIGGAVVMLVGFVLDYKVVKAGKQDGKSAE